MTKQLCTCAALIFPLLATADTLTLKNGNRFRGTFNNANSGQMSFTEYNGNRQNVNVSDVQELRFGNDNGGDYNNNSSPSGQAGFGRNDRGDLDQRNVNRANGLPGGVGNVGNAGTVANSGNGVTAEDLERLQSDLQYAMDNNNLTNDQRQSLDDSRATLRTAVQQTRNNRPVNQRNVRLALDSIRNASLGMRRQDRDVLNEDIRRVSASVSPTQNGGRDY